MTDNQFDVFLCHNSEDKPEVKKIGEQLKQWGLRPWLDEWELRPGFPWQRELEKQIANIKSAAIFVGSSGLGPWQINEIDAFLRQFVNRGCPVIPALLSTAPEKPELPIFLQGNMWVDFRQKGPEPMGKLIWAITGIKPEEQTLVRLITYTRRYPIKQPELDELVAIVNEIEDWNLVTSAYKETLPENATRDNIELNDPQKISEIINVLRGKYPTVGGDTPSILEFAKNLAGKFTEDSEEYPKIKSWVEEVSAKLDIPIEVNPKLESLSTTEQKTFLLITISPEDNKFRIKAEFILDENQKKTPQTFDFKELLDKKLLNIDYETDSGEGIKCGDKKISFFIEKIIDSFLEYYRVQISFHELIIEVFLPYEYLGKNLDNEWRIQEECSEDLIPIVQEYNIIFHPVERFIGNPRSYHNFTLGWSRLTKVLKCKYNTSSILKEIEIIQKIDSNNYRKIAANLSKKIGIKLTYPLPEKEQKFFWRAVLSGGIPLAFWTRYHTNENINLDDIDCHLTVDCLSNNFQMLIDNIHEIRRDAYIEENPQEQLGYHLGFICDNPNRMPIVKPLRSIF